MVVILHAIYTPSVLWSFLYFYSVDRSRDLDDPRLSIASLLDQRSKHLYHYAMILRLSPSVLLLLSHTEPAARL